MQTIVSISSRRFATVVEEVCNNPIVEANKPAIKLGVRPLCLDGNHVVARDSAFSSGMVILFSSKTSDIVYDSRQLE